MARKGLLDKLIEENELSKFLQLLNDGKSQKELARIYNTSQSAVCQTIKKIKNSKTNIEPYKEKIDIDKDILSKIEDKTPYEILYENRKQVVAWKRQGMYSVEIAKRMGVTDKDVFDFFDKRTKLTPKQIADIKKSYTNGKTIEAISQQYNTHPETIKKICKAVVVAREENINEGQEDVLTNLDCIADFTQFINQINYKVRYTTDEETKTEKEIQDLLHKIEIDDCNDEEGLKMLQRLKQLRQHRRECKDFLTLISPLVKFLEDDINAKALRTLTNIAGNINNKAKASQNRIYYLRTKEGE